MRALRNLPAGYAEAGAVRLARNPRLMLLLNVAAVPWAGLCVLAILGAATVVGPQRYEIGVGSLSDLAGLVAILVLTVVVHEAVHAALFWYWTGARPAVGMKGWYAYASAPGWYVPRGPFLVAGLAPLLGVSALGLGLVPFVSSALVGWILLGLIINATGSLGDLYLAVRVLRASGPVLVEDRPDGVTWFTHP
jgi:Putative zincin peptidase